MKTKRSLILPVAVAIISVFALAFISPDATDEPNEMLPIGAKAPLLNVPVKDVSGKLLTLGAVAGEKGLLVVFSCNTCPWVAAWEDRFNPVAELAKENNIGVIFLNPNTATRDQGDGFKDMQQRAEKSGYNFYYAIDKNSKIAMAFGATRTPHAYLFNSDLELVYRGGIDDNAHAKTMADIKNPLLKNAIKALSAGAEITVQTMASPGCGIKWPEG